MEKEMLAKNAEDQAKIDENMEMQEKVLQA